MENQEYLSLIFLFLRQHHLELVVEVVPDGGKREDELPEAPEAPLGAVAPSKDVIDVETVERDYDAAYPETYGATPPSDAALVDDARQRWRQSRLAYRDTLVTISAAFADNATDAGAIAGLVERSQDAAGALQAAQAGNQIEAMQTEQLMQMEAMMAAQYRAEALDHARELAEEERARARFQRFMED